MLPHEQTTSSDVVTLSGDMEGLVVAPSRDEARAPVSFLRSERLNVQLVMDVESAFEEILIHPPNVVLVADGSGGSSGGIELCRRIKGNGRTHFVPVVLWTASDQQEYRVRAWEAGADAVFSPTTDAREHSARLCALLRAHAIHRRQERQQRSQGSAIQTRRRWVDAFIHDLQNSLSALQANFEFLSRSIPNAGDDTRGGQVLSADVVDCVHDTRGIFNDMIRGLRTVLDYERLEAGRIIMRETSVRLADLVKDVVADLTPQAAAAGKKVVIQADENARAKVDNELMRGVLYNLIAYWLRRPLNDTVTVTVLSEDDGVKISVQGAAGAVPDGGEIEHLFEPYTRPQRQAPVGHGLGLALARAVVEMHAGTLGVEHTPGETGWAFRLHLPGETRNRYDAA